MSQIISATASSPISAGRGRMRTRRRKRSAPGSMQLKWSRRWRFKPALALLPALLWSETSRLPAAVRRRRSPAIRQTWPRLQALAEPGQVVIGGLTRQLIGTAFVLDDLGPQELKGIPGLVSVWRVLA